MPQRSRKLFHCTAVSGRARNKMLTVKDGISQHGKKIILYAVSDII